MFGRRRGLHVLNRDFLTFIGLAALLCLAVAVHVLVLLRTGREENGPPGPANWIVRFILWRRQRKSSGK